MNRMKTFLKYLIAIVLLYFFSNLIIEYSLKGNYSNIESGSIVQSENYNVNITEAKATKANGEIKGEITKKEEAIESNKYLKINFYNDRNNLMGTKYIQIKNLTGTEKQEFNLPFTYHGVSRFEIITVNEIDNSNIKTIKSSYFGLGVLLALIILTEVV